MHEVSLVTSLVDQVKTLAERENFTRVQKLNLAVGAFSGVSLDAIEFCFPEVIKNTLLEGAELAIEKIPLRVECLDCQKESLPEDIWDLSCVHCLSQNTKIKTGKEFRIADLIVY